MQRSLPAVLAATTSSCVYSSPVMFRPTPDPTILNRTRDLYVPAVKVLYMTMLLRSSAMAVIGGCTDRVKQFLSLLIVACPHRLHPGFAHHANFRPSMTRFSPWINHYLLKAVHPPRMSPAPLPRNSPPLSAL